MKPKKLLLCSVVIGCALAVPSVFAGERHGGPPRPSGGNRGNSNGATTHNSRGHGNWNGAANHNWRGHGHWRGGTNHNWRDRCHRGRNTSFVFFGSFGYPYFGYPYGSYAYNYHPYGYYDSYYPDYEYYGAAPVYHGRAASLNRGGSLVLQVQQRLARAGYYRGAIDGIIGSITRRAIRSYERAHGLPVDGRIDSSLLARMGLA